MDYRLEGFEQIAQALQELGRSVERKALREAAREGAKEVAMEARATAPFRTGRLRRSIVWRRNSRYSGPGKESWDVGVLIDQDAGRRGAYYWRFLEFGTRNMPARPFLRTSHERKTQSVIGNMSARIRRAVLEAAQERRNARR